MHYVFGLDSVKPPPSLLQILHHFDIDSIVGGRVRDMTRALIKNYLHLPNRYEIVVVAGRGGDH